MEQGSQEWLTIRRGKFTASNIVKLIGTGAKPGRFGNKLSDWSDTAQTYILSKVAESFSDKDQQVTSIEMRWGIEHEPEARAYYEGVFQEEVEEVGFILWPKNVNAGCSPDGIVKTLPGMPTRGIEIKCPYTLNAHMESFLIRSNQDFREMKQQYYWQVMSSMLFTGFESWDFVSYHPFFKPERRLTSIEIIADPVAFEILEERITAAVVTRDAIINEILNQ